MQVKLDSFSKLALLGLLFVWAAAAGFGAAYVWRSGSAEGLQQLFTLVTAPMTAGVMGYLAKSGFENVKKISQNNAPAAADQPTDAVAVNDAAVDEALSIAAGLGRQYLEQLSEVRRQNSQADLGESLLAAAGQLLEHVAPPAASVAAVDAPDCD